MRLPIVHHPDYQAPLKPGHRFPMSKYGYLRQALTKRGLMRSGDWLAPAPASAATLSLAHDAGYVSRAFSLTLSDQEMRVIGLPRTERVIRRARLSSAGTLLAARLALETGLACTGHSQCDTKYCPRGYCEPRPLLGEDCSQVGICAKGLVCDGLACVETDTRGPAECVYQGW